MERGNVLAVKLSDAAVVTLEALARARGTTAARRERFHLHMEMIQ